MRRPQKNGIEPVDEHSQPTEPMSFTVSPFAPTTTGENPATVPASYNPMPQQPPQIGAYPYLPPPLPYQGGYGGIEKTVPVQPVESTQAAKSTKKRRALPILVGMFFVAIQLALLARFVLDVVPFWNNTSWAATFDATTTLLIWPVQALLQQFAMPLAASIEISTLIAILAYGLLSRILVRVLKLVLRSL